MGQIVQDGTHGGGAGIAASEDVQHQPVYDLLVVNHVGVGLLELHVFVQGVVYRVGGDFLVGQLSLVLGDDLQCVENANESGPGSNGLDWVLVQEV